MCFNPSVPAATCRARPGDGRLMPRAAKLFGGMLVAGLQALEHLTLHADAMVRAGLEVGGIAKDHDLCRDSIVSNPQ